MLTKRLTNNNDKLQPTHSLVLLGGMENSLSLTRSMGRLGVKVFVIAPSNCAAHHSKYCVRSWCIPDGVSEEAYYKDFFFSQDSEIPFKDSIVLACSDRAIAFLAQNEKALSKRFILDITPPELHQKLLDKQETLRLADMVGVDFPKHWEINQLADIEDIESEIQFPVLIKPIHSHKFQAKFKAKLFLVETFPDLLSKAKQTFDAGLAFMLCEHIPGPDTLLSSYYTYMDEDGKEWLSFTKRIIRRSPKNFGRGSCHVTEWLPETAKVGQQFFKGIGFKGLGNIEFKRDPRDNRLKIIECNARFTAAQEQVFQSGVDIGQIIYRRLTNQPCQGTKTYRQFLYYWYFDDDFDAYRDLRREGEITFREWASIWFKPKVFPYWSLSDLKPFWFMLKHNFSPRLKRIFRME